MVSTTSCCLALSVQGTCFGCQLFLVEIWFMGCSHLGGSRTVELVDNLNINHAEIWFVWLKNQLKLVHTNLEMKN